MRKNIINLLIVGMAALALAMTGCTNTASSPSASATSKKVVYKAGDTFQVADLQYTVDSVRIANSSEIGTNEKGFMGGVSFYVLNLTVKNLSATATKLDWKRFIAYVGEKEQFAPVGGFYLEKDPNHMLVFMSVNPNASVTGYLLYKVHDPKAGELVKVTDGQTNGESAMVQLQ